MLALKSPNSSTRETPETCFYEVPLPPFQARLARLVLNFREQIVSLVQVEESPWIQAQTRLTRNEWRVFLLLLTHPEGSTYAQVMASLQCSKEVWPTTLADKSGDTWHKMVLAWEEAFQHAKHHWKREVKPVHEVIFHLRTKLRPFGLRLLPYDPLVGYLLQPSSELWPHLEAILNEQAWASLGEVVASFLEEQTDEELSSRLAPKKEGS